MPDNENWMDSFRAKNGGNIYVLQVRVVEEGIEVKNIEEVVDCPKGEAGVRYAGNLLCRLANEAARGTKMEMSPWRQSHKISGVANKDYRYRKAKDSENYAVAEMEWHENKKKRKH